jgi:hypothetical protein
MRSARSVCLGGTSPVPRWDTHRPPVGYTPYPSGVPTVPQWGRHRLPVGYTPSPSGVHTVPQWGTHRPPVGYTPSPSGVHTVPQWGTHRPPVGYAPRNPRLQLHQPYRLRQHRRRVHAQRLFDGGLIPLLHRHRDQLLARDPRSFKWGPMSKVSPNCNTFDFGPIRVYCYRYRVW